MSKLILYYSFTGNTAKRAREFADANGAELVEVKSAGKIGKFKAYTAGCFRAMKGAAMPIEPLAVDLSGIDEADIFAPIWAGVIAPPMNAALMLLAKGTKVSLHLVSGGGKSNRERNTAQVAALGLEVAGYEDLR